MDIQTPTTLNHLTSSSSSLRPQPILKTNIKVIHLKKCIRLSPPLVLIPIQVTHLIKLLTRPTQRLEVMETDNLNLQALILILLISNSLRLLLRAMLRFQVKPQNLAGPRESLLQVKRLILNSNLLFLPILNRTTTTRILLQAQHPRHTDIHQLLPMVVVDTQPTLLISTRAELHLELEGDLVDLLMDCLTHLLEVAMEPILQILALKLKGWVAATLLRARERALGRILLIQVEWQEWWLINNNNSSKINFNFNNTIQATHTTATTTEPTPILKDLTRILK